MRYKRLLMTLYIVTKKREKSTKEEKEKGRGIVCGARKEQSLVGTYKRGFRKRFVV